MGPDNEGPECHSRLKAVCIWRGVYSEEGDVKHFKVVMFVFEEGTFWKDRKDHLIMWLR